jgi:hypothetical protein
LYVSGFSFGYKTTFTWGSFTERVEFDTGAGAPGDRVTYNAADLIGTGTQSDTATSDDSSSGAWRCHTLVFNEEVVADSWTGVAYTDDDEGTGLGSTSICAAVNGGASPACNTTDGSGNFTIDTSNAAVGDQLTFYVDGATSGNTVTVSDGGDIIAGDNLRVYQNHVVVRYEQGSSITINDMSLYDDDDNSADMLYTAATFPSDSLSVESTHELFVDNDFTFAPGGNVTQVHDVEVAGLWSAAAGETITLDGTFNVRPGGEFSPSTGTVTFDATTGTEDLITAGTGTLYNLTVDDADGATSGYLTVQVQDPLDVDNDFTISSGRVDTVSGENNQITVGNIFTNDGIFTAQNGAVVLDGTTGTITGTTDPAFYDLTIDPTSAGTITLSNTEPSVSNLLTVANGDTLSIVAGVTLTHSGTLSLDGTISGSGTYSYIGSDTLPATGNLNGPVRYNASNGNKTVSDRDYGGDLELFSNSGSERTITLGSAEGQTINVSGNLYIIADGGQNLNVAGQTYNPTVNITGNLDFTGGGAGTEVITSGSSPWNITGSVDFTGGTYNASVNNSLRMDGASTSITTNGQTLYNFEVFGGSVTSIDAMDADGSFSLSSGTFVHGDNVDLNVAGDFTLTSGTTFDNADGTGWVIFDGDTTLTATTEPNHNLGSVRIGAP